MAAPFTGIDHVVIAVDDLDRARLSWERLGFTLTPRGRHFQQGTGNYCVMFARDYIELLGVVDRAQDAGTLRDFLTKGPGLRALAFATHSAEATAAELARRGIPPGAPRTLARQLELPEGTVLPRFRLVSLPASATPGVSAFVCEHETAELVRRREWLLHPNGATAVHGVIALVDATEPLRGAWERLLGGDLTTTDDVLTAHVGAHRITFATPEHFAELYPEAVFEPPRALPAIAALVLESRDLAETADHLTRWHVAHEVAVDGAVLVPAAEASGTLLIFGASRANSGRPFPPGI